MLSVTKKIEFSISRQTLLNLGTKDIKKFSVINNRTEICQEARRVRGKSDVYEVINQGETGLQKGDEFTIVKRKCNSTGRLKISF